MKNRRVVEEVDPETEKCEDHMFRWREHAAGRPWAGGHAARTVTREG